MAPPSYQELIARLPRTFGPALNDQFRQWDLLFPAERRLLRAQLDWLEALGRDEFAELFAPIAGLERKMDLPPPRVAAAGMTIHDTGVLARSPMYPQWRTEVERVFARINSAVESAGAVSQVRRLLVCVLPAGLSAEGQTLWANLEARGAWVKLDRPFGEALPGFTAMLRARKLPEGLEADEGAWFVECEPKWGAPADARATSISWSGAAAVRREFLSRLNKIRRDLKSADETTEELRRMDVAKLIGPELGGRPRVREFLRAILLSGNGSLVFSNSFVQWASSEALRRAQPQALVSGFGIRPRLKPFSGVVLFEDQNRSNPVADELDPAGSLVDGQMLSRYVYYAAQGLTAYKDRTITVFGVEDLARILVVDAKPQSPVPERFAEGELAEWAMRWLAG